MAHHGSNPLENMSDEEMKKAFANPFTTPAFQHHLDQANEHMGATKKFPDEKIDDSDDGEIAYGIAVYRGKLIFNFGENPVSWIGLTQDQVADLIVTLQKRIKEL